MILELLSQAISSTINYQAKQDPIKTELVLKIEKLAEKYGQDPKTAQDIISCESSFNATSTNVNPPSKKTGYATTTDYGYWQLNDYYWGDYLMKKGFDITDPEDNLEAGFIVLKKYGIKPWYLSQDCVDKINNQP